MHDALLLGTRPERLRELAAILSSPAAPATLEAALPDLLRDGDDAVLGAVAAGLVAFRSDPGGLRVLESLVRRSGTVRSAALRALRGEVAAASTAPAPAVAPARTPTPAAPALAPTPAPAPAPAPTPMPATAATVTPSATGADWATPFEAVLADPSAELIRKAALMLLELADARPATATREALHALAGRLAMASFDHEGQVQQGLGRLAKGLKALS